MKPALVAALNRLASIKYPSIERILVTRGFPYEASLVAEVVRLWEEHSPGPRPLRKKAA